MEKPRQAQATTAAAVAAAGVITPFARTEPHVVPPFYGGGGGAVPVEREWRHGLWDCFTPFELC